GAIDARLPAQLALDADFVGHASHFAGKGGKPVHHAIDGVLQLENFALNVHGNLLGQIAIGHSGSDLSNVPNLRGEVSSHGVDRICQVAPGSADSLDIGLSAELAFGTDFARDAGDFRRERAQLVHHGVDGVFELQDFAFDRNGNFARQIAI